MNQDESFYIGYMDQMDPPLARRLRPWVRSLFLLIAVLALVLAAFQSPFSASSFEFGQYRSFEGVILERPCPMIRLDRPLPSEQESERSAESVRPAGSQHSLYYLAHFGKRGADEDIKGLHGKRVRLEAALIYRDDQTMVELRDPAKIEVLGEGESAAESIRGEVVLNGEIVDSKCFFGVMNPGNLAVHKACAIRCIAGGIPPVLLLRTASGEARYLLLTDEDGAILGKQILDKIAIPVQVTGKLSVLDNLFVLKTKAEAIRPLP